MIKKRYRLSLSAQIFLLGFFFLGILVAVLFVSGYRINFSAPSFLEKSGFVVFSSPISVLTKDNQMLKSDSIYESFPVGKYDFCASQFFFSSFCVKNAPVQENNLPILSLEDIMLFPRESSSHFRVYAMENIFFDPGHRGVFWQEKQGNMLKGIDMYSGEIVFSEFFSPLKKVEWSEVRQQFVASFANGKTQEISIFSPDILGLSAFFYEFPYPVLVSRDALFRSPEKKVTPQEFAFFDLPIISFFPVPKSDIVFVELGKQLFAVRLSVFEIQKIGNVDWEKPVLFSLARKEIFWQEKGVLKGFFW